MTDYLTKAIFELGVKDWVLRGKPTTEAEFNSMFRKVTGADSNGTAIESDKTSDFGVTWKQVSDKKKALEDAEPMRLLRAKRDVLLAETDWTQANDSPLSDSKKAEWKTYRQTLRDLTSKVTPKFLSNSTRIDESDFPTKPS